MKPLFLRGVRRAGWLTVAMSSKTVHIASLQIGESLVNMGITLKKTFF